MTMVTGESNGSKHFKGTTTKITREREGKREDEFGSQSLGKKLRALKSRHAGGYSGENVKRGDGS